MRVHDDDVWCWRCLWRSRKWAGDAPAWVRGWHLSIPPAAMRRPQPHLNTSRSSTHTNASVVAATVAERGQSYISDISPNMSPFSLVLTLNITSLRRSST